jgi:hypothetical protein
LLDKEKWKADQGPVAASMAEMVAKMTWKALPNRRYQSHRDRGRFRSIESRSLFVAFSKRSG